MNKISEEHKELLFEWANDWWFKEGVMSYSEVSLYKKLLHGKWNGNAKSRTPIDSYTDEERDELNEIREKWISYRKGEMNDMIPDQYKVRV